MTQSPTPRTQVDPHGLAKLYLRTHEIHSFFDQMMNYCEMGRQKAKRFYTTLLVPYTFISLAIFVYLLNEIGFDEDDEGGIIIIYSIVAVIVFFVMIGMFMSRLHVFDFLKGRATLLQTFFKTIEDDIHPESGLKGFIDHRRHSADHIYKTKTSPYSGSTKNYYKYPWALFKFTLLDGSMVRVKCVDKVKEKSSSVVRYLNLQKGEIYLNTLLYQTQGNQLSFSRHLANSESQFKDESEKYGLKMAQVIKSNLTSRSKRNVPVPSLEQVNTKGTQKKTTASVSNTSDQAMSTPPPKSQSLLTANDPFNKCVDYMLGTTVPNIKIDQLFSDHGTLIHKEPGSNEGLEIQVELGENQGESFIRLTASVAANNEKPETLLKANPALAHARFAKSNEELKMVKTLLFDTLDQEELDSALKGLIHLGHQLQKLNALPQKSKAYKFKREFQWEEMLLKESLRNVDYHLEAKEKKFKVTLPLKQGRKQSVQVRFDRQDLDGQQMISILSYCGQVNPELYETCLQENMQLTYGAIGLAKLGEQELFVVSDNQVAQTADPEELRTAILQVAQKADDLEALLSPTDHY